MVMVRIIIVKYESTFSARMLVNINITYEKSFRYLNGFSKYILSLILKGYLLNHGWP